MSSSSFFKTGADFNPLRPCGRRRPLCPFAPFLFPKFQSTPPVWAETSVRDLLGAGRLYFNPLRPCGRRPRRCAEVQRRQLFQSTPPVWAETTLRAVASLHNVISIHSARVGGDSRGIAVLFRKCAISIHSARVGGDSSPYLMCGKARISIHSARVGGDLLAKTNFSRPMHFNPLRPCGRRRRGCANPRYTIVFQSTPPVWAETRINGQKTGSK